ncbi:DUF5919 domain-containing protein [Streptomyces sp. BE147]|uniref:DUF5919 domain-containing protein n=1 Tax=Streptomyces sp. BE147 TaxID=3002524 RepID=UPI002E773E8D|nr:DUF5919 domain-containing protein [Streptomyces sp. BE147]MEE1741191.1 DUF5919 domain-containing protein [Streptomyces sp. BE147]
MSSESAAVVPLHGRTYRPDFQSLARGQFARAREAKGMSHEAFAELLTTMLGWPVGPDTVKLWETKSVPPGDALAAAELIVRQTPPTLTDVDPQDALTQIVGDQFADLSAVFASRSEFQAKFPTSELLDNAREIRACGLSLNMLCQTYSEARLREIIENGTTLRCLFLDPEGRFIAEREKEEGYPEGRLSALTAMNLTILQERVLQRLSPEAQGRCEIGVYDEPIRFSVLLLDGQLCVAQPYLPDVRGIDSLTLVIRKRRVSGGLYAAFEQVFSSLWERRLDQ